MHPICGIAPGRVVSLGLHGSLGTGSEPRSSLSGDSWGSFPGKLESSGDPVFVASRCFIAYRLMIFILGCIKFLVHPWTPSIEPVALYHPFFRREIWPPRRLQNGFHFFFQPKSSVPEPEMEGVRQGNRCQVFQARQFLDQ